METTAVRPGHGTEQALLDAAERLLVDVGAAGITTRRVAEEAKVNLRLVHTTSARWSSCSYACSSASPTGSSNGSVRCTRRTSPFIEKWRTAMGYLDEDRPYQKIWFELQALAWNRPDLRERLARVHAEWRAVLIEAFAPVRDDLGLEIRSKRSSRSCTRSTRDHPRPDVRDRARAPELLDWIDGWLEKSTR
jgi:AcrR family transcriptional regulator